MSRVDPRNRGVVATMVVARYGPAGGSGSVAADASALWITAHDVNAVYRLPLS